MQLAIDRRRPFHSLADSPGLPDPSGRATTLKAFSPVRPYALCAEAEHALVRRTSRSASQLGVLSTRSVMGTRCDFVGLFLNRPLSKSSETR
jgi:hypothetical protein